MVRDKGCASVGASVNDVDSDAAVFCPGMLFLPRLMCVFVVIGCTGRMTKMEITRKTSI